MSLPVEIKGFPLPPSANELYANIPGRGRIKTEALKSFEAEVHYWSMKNQHLLLPARELCQSIGPGCFIRLHKFFYFRPHKILTKSGEPRKNDTSNRIKALEDVLAKLLGIDDKWFWAGNYDKGPVLHPAIPEGVDLRLELYSPSLSTSKLEDEEDEDGKEKEAKKNKSIRSH